MNNERLIIERTKNTKGTLLCASFKKTEESTRVQIRHSLCLIHYYVSGSIFFLSSVIKISGS
nr:hypothetical protein [Spirochaetota bacterium]